MVHIRFYVFAMPVVLVTFPQFVISYCIRVVTGMIFIFIYYIFWFFIAHIAFFIRLWQHRCAMPIKKCEIEQNEGSCLNILLFPKPSGSGREQEHISQEVGNPVPKFT